MLICLSGTFPAQAQKSLSHPYAQMGAQAPKYPPACPNARQNACSACMLKRVLKRQNARPYAQMRSWAPKMPARMPKHAPGRQNACLHAQMRA